MSYHPGHPWYYKKRGEVLYPSVIIGLAVHKGWKGYDQGEAVDKADNMKEPHRTTKLHELLGKYKGMLCSDLKRYRECVREYRKWLEQPEDDEPFSNDIHQSMCLKHNHIYNHGAMYRRCKRKLETNEQMSLF